MSDTEGRHEAAIIELEGTLEGGKYSGPWWADTADRTVSTIAQTAIAYLTIGAIPNLLEVDVVTLAAVSGTAGILAFLKALAVTRA